MSSFLGWQQKWGVSGSKLTWSDAWTEGHLLGDVSIAMTGRMTLAQSGFECKITFQLGDVSLGMVGHSAISGNPISIIPGDHVLGNLRLAMAGRMTLSGGPFDTVDPFWIDPPNVLGMTAHMGFPGTITIAKVLSHQLGAVTLPMVAHLTLPKPQSISNTIRKDLGALSLSMIGGIDMTADLTARTGGAHALGDVTLGLVGHPTLASSNLISLLPPHPLGNLTLDLVGHMTTTTRTIHAGGPISIDDVVLNMTGKLGARMALSYPPFDVEMDIEAVIDPTVTTIVAKVEPDNLNAE